eukprot:s3703_g2.t1
MEGFSKCSDPLSKKVVEYLHRADVRRVVVGHKPSGEAPAILRTRGVDGKGCLDEDEQMRGQSWCEVRISQDSGHSQTRLRGQRPDGLGEYDFKLQVLGSDPAGDDGDALVGHQARYGKQWVWVRLKLNSGDYLLSRGYGRTAEYWAKKASEFQVIVSAELSDLKPGKGKLPDVVRFRLCTRDRSKAHPCCWAGGISEPVPLTFAPPRKPPQIQRILSDDRWNLSFSIELFKANPPPSPIHYLGTDTQTLRYALVLGKTIPQNRHTMLYIFTLLQAHGVVATATAVTVAMAAVAEVLPLESSWKTDESSGSVQICERSSLSRLFGGSPMSRIGQCSCGAGILSLGEPWY